METANLGARNAGGKSVGLGISLPFEQGVNDYIPEELNFEFYYFLPANTGSSYKPKHSSPFQVASAPCMSSLKHSLSCKLIR